MKTDLYTKVVLTVIAFCLTVNLLKDFNVIESARAADAQPVPMPVQVMDVNIQSVGGQRVSRGELPVLIEGVKYGTKLDVDVKSWSAGRLDVGVDRWNASRVAVEVDRWSAGTLDVKTR